MSTPTTCDPTSPRISAPELASGPPRFAELGSLTIGAFGLLLSPANLSARQAKAAGLLTSGIYGQHFSISSRPSALSELLVNKYRVKTASLGSTLYKLTWKARTTPAGRLIYAVRASGRPISASELTGWPTPTTPSGGQVPPEGTSATGLTPDGRKVQVTLKDVAHLAAWNTPRATDGSNGGPNQAGGALSADAHLAGWPTPMAGTPAQNGNNEAGNTDSSRRTVQLAAPQRTGEASDDPRPGPVNGFWRDADWISCRDPGGTRWRPVEPFSFPLATGVAGRVGKLRAYGNACNLEVATHFLAAATELMP